MANAIAAFCYAFIMYHFECLAIACCVFFLQFHLSTHRFQWVSMDQYFLLIIAMSDFQDLRDRSELFLVPLQHLFTLCSKYCVLTVPCSPMIQGNDRYVFIFDHF